jgi:hypothetical protein
VRLVSQLEYGRVDGVPGQPPRTNLDPSRLFDVTQVVGHVFVSDRRPEIVGLAPPHPLACPVDRVINVVSIP